MSKRVVTTREFMSKAQKMSDELDEMTRFVDGIRGWLDKNLTKEQEESLIKHMKEVFGE